MAYPTIRVPVSSIRLKPGEVVTVYLDGRQVELRVPTSGRPEVFLDRNDISIVSFDDWSQLV